MKKKIELFPNNKVDIIWFFVRWVVIFSAISIFFIFATHMPGESFKGDFPPLTDSESNLLIFLKRHILKLSNEIGIRNILKPNSLDLSAEYIEDYFKSCGYQVKRHALLLKKEEIKRRFASILRMKKNVIDELLKPLDEQITLYNIEAELIGKTSPSEIILVGAHYDSFGSSPGANDNASGVAAILEMARLISKETLPRTIRFVAFVNEEPPFYNSNLMGSWGYAHHARSKNEKIVGMIAIETIGYYTSRPKSQKFLFPLNFFYPQRANFIGFVSNFSSRALLRKCIVSFRKQVSFPSEGIIAPSWFAGVCWSDHLSFWKQGYPAIMVTDTALFRYSHYHGASDRADKIDYPSYARVVLGLVKVIIDISRQENI